LSINIVFKFRENNSEKSLLTRFDGRETSKECNGIHDALLSLEAAGAQDPSRAWMDDKGIKEKGSKTGKVV
jgi:hypothetical protein